MSNPRKRKAAHAATPLEKAARPVAPDEGGNSGKQLPGVYELCRIAVALRESDAEKNPVEAVKTALGLWLAAEYEISRAKRREWGSNVVTYCRELEGTVLGDSVKDLEKLGGPLFNPDKQPVAFGSSDSDSEAMKWLETNGKDSEDPFKRFTNFESAWTETFNENAAAFRKHCTVGALKLFLEIREVKRLAADRRRKRIKQLEKKLRSLEEKLALTILPAAEIEAQSAEVLALAKKKDPASKRRLKEVMEKWSTRNVPGKKSILPGSNG